MTSAVNLHSFLAALVVLLAVLIVATSVFQKLRLGSVIGLIVAGIALGPWGLHIAPHVDRLLNFTELGVVLLMFTIGLEMAPKKLWTIRRLVFGLGISCQCRISCQCQWSGISEEPVFANSSES
jgi:glutathione-regulated potassium-efflux system ancillary protein KefC